MKWFRFTFSPGASFQILYFIQKVASFLDSQVFSLWSTLHSRNRYFWPCDIWASGTVPCNPFRFYPWLQEVPSLPSMCRILGGSFVDLQVLLSAAFSPWGLCPDSSRHGLPSVSSTSLTQAAYRLCLGPLHGLQQLWGSCYFPSPSDPGPSLSSV